MVSRPALVLGTLWVAGAAFATSVGLVAVQQVGNEVGDQVSSPLSTDAVHRALVSVPPVSTESELPAQDGPEELGPVRTVSTQGGVLGARCHDHAPVLLYATPADGYRTERSGSDVRFVGSRVAVRVRMSCSDESLVAASTVEGLRTAQSATTPAATAPSPAAAQPESPNVGTSEPADTAQETEGH